MKKILEISFVLSLVFFLSACGKAIDVPLSTSTEVPTVTKADKDVTQEVSDPTPDFITEQTLSVKKIAELLGLELEVPETKILRLSETKIPVIEKKIEQKDVVVYSVNPNNEQKTCKGYGVSNCVNFIVSRTDNSVIYSDLDQDSSLGNLVLANDTYVFFEEGMGEGSMCGGGGKNTLNVYLLDEDTVKIRENSYSSRCPADTCPCTEEQLIKTNAIEYKNLAGEIINETEQLQSIFIDFDQSQTE